MKSKIIAWLMLLMTCIGAQGKTQELRINIKP